LDEAREHRETLAALGLYRIADLLALPADGLARRFGQAVLDEVRRALGELPDARKMFVPPETWSGQLELPAPALDSEALLFAANRLMHELCGFLCMRRLGASRMQLTLLHEDYPPTVLDIKLAPSRSSEHMLLVLRERMAHLALPEAVTSLELALRESAPLASVQAGFYPDARQTQEAQVQLIERLRARLGNHAVYGVKPNADHRPEFAWRYCEPGTKPSDAAPANGKSRPLWLLATPRALSADPQVLGMHLLKGPERIESGWWDDQDVMRDYYVAITETGERQWIFRSAEGWFLHGEFC
jgi:protein ImuB